MISRFLKHWLTRRPYATRAVLSFLRRRQQVLVLGGNAIALGHSAVVEILANERDFTVREANRDGFATGPVLLYTDESTVYRDDEKALDNAFCPGLKTRIEADTDAVINQYLERKDPAAMFDVVADFAEPVVGTIIARNFFGIDPQGEDLDVFRNHLRQLGTSLIDGEISKKAQHAADEISRHIDNRRHQADALDLAARLHCADNPAVASVTGSVAGLSLAASATVARGLGQVADRLVKDQSLLQHIEHSLSNQISDPTELIDQLVRESLRFAPVLVFIRRYALRDTQLSAASGGAVLPRGCRILVGLAPAMFDESAFPNPHDFRLDRPAESYLHFGDGLHRCYGATLAEMFLRKMTLALIERKLLHGAQMISSDFKSWALTNYRVGLNDGN
jgi:cytochrome P450